MDCCNYVEAYSAGGHFYQQQQQYFCYDNGNAAYAGYDAAPISNTIEINARYNGAIPTTYPTGRLSRAHILYDSPIRTPTGSALDIARKNQIVSERSLFCPLVASAIILFVKRACTQGNTTR